MTMADSVPSSASRLSNLPLPVKAVVVHSDSNTAQHKHDKSSRESVGQRTATAGHQRYRATLCPYAVAVGRTLFGRKVDSSDHDEIDTTPTSSSSTNHSCCWTWQTKLPHDITQLSASPNGTVLVVATGAPTVALIRRVDGRILAVRPLDPVGNENTIIVPSFRWIPSYPSDAGVRDPSNVYENFESLLIEVPPSPCSALLPFSKVDQEVNVDPDDHDDESRFWLVSHIYGTAIQDAGNDTALLSQAMQRLRMQRLNLNHAVPDETTLSQQRPDLVDRFHDTNLVSRPSLRAVAGYGINPMTLGLLACDEDGKVALYECSLDVNRTNQLRCLVRGVSIQPQKNTASVATECIINYDLGFATQTVRTTAPMAPNDNSTKTYFVCNSLAIPGVASTCLHWIDPDSRQVVCDYSFSAEATAGSSTTTTPLPSTSGGSSKIVALQEIASAQPHESVLLVAASVQTNTIHSNSKNVALSSSRNTTTSTTGMDVIYVLQILVEETLGLTLLTQPHVLYRIPAEPNGFAISLSKSPKLSNADDRSVLPGAFEFQVWNDQYGNGSSFQLWEFVPHCDCLKRLSRIRAQLERNQFTLAKASLQHEQSSDFTTLLMNDRYADFHPSDIGLRQLEYWQEHETPVTVTQLVEQLTSLSVEALQQSEKGLVSFLQAVQILRARPFHITLSEFIGMLSYVADEMERLIQTLPSETVSEMNVRLGEVQDHRESLQYLLIHGDIAPDCNGNKYGIPLHEIQSPAQLYRYLIRHRKFASAEALCHSPLRFQLEREAVVMPLLEDISATSINRKSVLSIDPQTYLPLIEDTIMPNLPIHHVLVSRLAVWACQLADAMDNHDDNDVDAASHSKQEHSTTFGGLESAIALLKVMDRSIKKQQVKIHESFAWFSPFGNRSEQPRHRSTRSPRSEAVTKTLDSSHSSESNMTGMFTASVCTKQRLRVDDSITSEFCGHAIPTIIEMSGFHSGASKASMKTTFAIPDEYSDFESPGENVETRLRNALCIREARRLGLPKQTVRLGSFASCGGAQTVATELVRFFSSNCNNDDDRLQCLTQYVAPFCASFSVSYERALLELITEKCTTTQKVLPSDIVEASAIVRCCNAWEVKCQATLLVLRAALFCGYSSIALSALSKDAIRWATNDSGLRSELEEASRLVVINGIVAKYCGKGALELFRVDNPRHANRLLDYLTQFVAVESVVDDSFSLCDAFTHLSRKDACRKILSHSVLGKKEEATTKLLDQINTRDPSLACSTVAGAVAFCENVLSWASSNAMSSAKHARKAHYQREAIQIAAQAKCLLSWAVDQRIAVSRGDLDAIEYLLDDAALDVLLEKISCVISLQQEHSIFVSLADFVMPGRIIPIARSLVDDIARYHKGGDPRLLNNRITFMRRAFRLLSGGSEQLAAELWVAACGMASLDLVKKKEDDDILPFLHDLGLLDQQDVVSHLLSDVHVRVALAICDDADPVSPSAAKRVVRGFTLLREYALVFASEKSLAHVFSISQAADVVGGIFARMDEGVGEEIETYRKELQLSMWRKRHRGKGADDCALRATSAPLTARPSFHATWYVGDGLLLPPQQALRFSLDFFKEKVGFDAELNDESMNLFEFLGSRGAHLLSLRVYFSVTNTLICGKAPSFDAADAVLLPLSDTVQALAERSLGGNGTGITSSVIDSQLSVAFLHSLPMKMAFKIYQLCLQTAIKTQDFARLLTLSNIGRAGSSKCSRPGDGWDIGWKGQDKFAEQCANLALNAKWWSFLRLLGVDFDRRKLNLQSESKSNNRQGGVAQHENYASSLIPGFIDRLLRVYTTRDSLRLACLFARDFGLPVSLVHQNHVKLALSPMLKNETEGSRSFYQADLVTGQKAARASLRLILDPLVRLKVIRNCLVAMDRDPYSGQDYERFRVVLAFYQEELALLLDSDLAMQTIDPGPVESTLNIVNRKCDALAILLSYFHGDRASLRPPFPSFFEVEGEDVSKQSSQRRPLLCGVLGIHASGKPPCYFDPLEGLEKSLSACFDLSTASALAPLCIPLDLPPGYIHARSLVVRFLASSGSKASFPSLENDIVPVLNRLRAPLDRAVLAEWCSSFYGATDNEKLQCLDLTLHAAIQDSTEIEHVARKNAADKQLADRLTNALMYVQRLSCAKDSLTDRLRVKAVLHGSIEPQERFSSVLEELMKEIEALPHDTNPEGIIDCLFSSGSRLLAEAALNENVAATVNQIRRFSSIIKSCCAAFTEHYSHIHPDRHAKWFVQNWLFSGNATCIDKVVPFQQEKENQPSDVFPTREDDTINFEMDLAGIDLVGEDWHRSGTICQGGTEKGLTSDEEPSALQATSAREQSDTPSRIAAIRIAFGMTFIEESNKMARNEAPNGATDSHPATNSQALRKRVGLLKILDSKRDNRRDDRAAQLGLQLLRIVFASPTASQIHSVSAYPNEKARYRGGLEMPKTVTFAMRHRALRAASILCPQEALEQLARSEGFVMSKGRGTSCSLKQCTYGVFVAKEIEEMGLSLPHSDLGQLSTMHALSYARTLWHHYRDHDLKRTKGRLLLLLMEMSLRDAPTDTLFVNALLDEMVRLNLPRTLLFSLERISTFIHTNILDTNHGFSIFRPIDFILNAVLAECSAGLSHDSSATIKGSDQHVKETLMRLRRLTKIFKPTTSSGERQLKLLEGLLENL